MGDGRQSGRRAVGETQNKHESTVKKERVEKPWFPRTAISNKQCLYLFGEKGTCDRVRRYRKAVVSTNSNK